jgi:hypothetical protein
LSIDPGTGHSGIGYNGSAPDDGFQRFVYRPVGKAQILYIIKIGSGMNDSFNERALSSSSTVFPSSSEIISKLRFLFLPVTDDQTLSSFFSPFFKRTYPSIPILALIP